MHFQELAQFGSLQSRCPNTPTVQTPKTENSFLLPLCFLEYDLTSVIMPSLSYETSLMKAVSATTPSETPLKRINAWNIKSTLQLQCVGLSFLLNIFQAFEKLFTSLKKESTIIFLFTSPIRTQSSNYTVLFCAFLADL